MLIVTDESLCLYYHSAAQLVFTLCKVVFSSTTSLNHTFQAAMRGKTSKMS